MALNTHLQFTRKHEYMRNKCEPQPITCWWFTATTATVINSVKFPDNCCSLQYVWRGFYSTHNSHKVHTHTNFTPNLAITVSRPQAQWPRLFSVLGIWTGASWSLAEYDWILQKHIWSCPDADVVWLISHLIPPLQTQSSVEFKSDGHPCQHQLKVWWTMAVIGTEV